MATYRELVGKKIKKVTSDPSDSLDGQMWYNSTTGTIRGLAISEAWASSGPLPEANYGAAGAGSQTAMIYFGGSPYPARTNKTAEYNGTGWSAGGNYTGTVNYLSGCGTLTAGLGAGGFTGTATLTASAEYDGSTWTSGNSMSNQRMNTGSTMVGIQTAALITGGDQYPSTPRSLSACEEYDGTNWTGGGAYPVVIQNTAQAGTQTAGWAAGGQSDPAPGVSNIVRNATNHYDGSSWSAGGNLPGAQMRAGAAGTQTAGLFFGGGQTSDTNATFAYDGSTWSSKPNLASSRQSLAAGGVSSPSTAAIGAGGYQTGSGVISSTEEFTASTNVITGAAWASGGNMPASYYGFSAFAGTQTAGIALGGKTPPGDQATILKYDGSSWSANPSNLNTARRSGASVGTQTATLLSGGVTGGTTFKNEVEEFDGSSASAQNPLPYSGSSNFGFGTQTAAVVAGGYAPPFPTLSSTNAEYDGTNWTNVTALPAARGLGGSAGMAQTTGLIWAGLSPSAVNTTLEYDGTNWTAGGTYGESKSNVQGWGDQTSAIGAGGETSGDSTNTFVYDGTTWSTQPSLPGARKQAGSGGADATAGLIFGGETPPITNTTIEFTGETTTANVKDFETS
jgi:hypothetical protein